MTLMDRLAEIRSMQGLDPLPDPTHVQGFGPNDPPVGNALPLGPPLDPDLPTDWIDPELDEGKEPPYMQQPPSPLIPRRAGAVQSPAPATPAVVEQLLSLVELLTWNGLPAPLSAEDKAAIRAITLKAFQRGLASALGEVVYKRTRRSRMPSSKLVDPPADVAPRKRGRPRKVQP